MTITSNESSQVPTQKLATPLLENNDRGKSKREVEGRGTKTPRNIVARKDKGCGVHARLRWRSLVEIALLRGVRTILEQSSTQTAGQEPQTTRVRRPISSGLNQRVGLRDRLKMGLVSWVKRHYYHYSISTGTYSFYPAEKIMVNACTLTLFGLTAYYIFRSVWFALVYLTTMVIPQKGP